MPTYTNKAKSSAPSYTNQTKLTNGTINIGNPIGLLLSLTYANSVAGVAVYTNRSRSSQPTYTNKVKSA